MKRDFHSTKRRGEWCRHHNRKRRIRTIQAKAVEYDEWDGADSDASIFALPTIFDSVSSPFRLQSQHEKTKNYHRSFINMLCP